MTHGPIAGAVTDTRAKLWLRTSAAARVTIRYSPNAKLKNAKSTRGKYTHAAQDFALRLKLNQLAPWTTYYYQVLVDDVPQLQPPYPHFTTFASAGSPATFRFGVLTDFGSPDTAPPEKPVRVDTFKQLAQENPAFVVIGGDLWHNEVDRSYNPVPSREDFIAQTRARYQAMYSYNSSQGPYDDFVNYILPNFALAHFWDDHDIGRNNATKNFSWKREARQVLQDFFPTYPMTKFGDWQSFSYGQADFFLLDARSQRDGNSDPDDSDKSLLDGDNLGAQGQWDWLTNHLLNSTARWKIIFSPVVFNPTLQKIDAWYAFQTERARLLDFISAHHITGVFIISGDAHAGAMDDGTNAGLPEMLVPGPNMKGSCFTAHNVGTWSHGVYGQLVNNGCRGYAVVQISTNPDRALLQVKDEHGQVKLQLELQPSLVISRNDSSK